MSESAESTLNVMRPVEASGNAGVLAVPVVMGGAVPRRALIRRLDEAERVVLISAPAGSGKTVLLRSWVAEPGLAQRTVWVSAAWQERDPRSFWNAVSSALRGTEAGAALLRPLTAGPDLDLDGWAIVERLLTDLAPLADRLSVVIDDVHELSTDALRQLELMILRAPQELRFVLATQHDVPLGLHHLRLDRTLTEIRQVDLRFSGAEARELFAAAGMELPGLVTMVLRERTEGWAAGLRLAALALAGHPDPGRFAVHFSVSKQPVAEYLLAEVLARQPAEIRRLLLRTSILERVNGELADLLTGDEGAERVLQGLEESGAFVMSLDPARTWFRFHQIFARLLTLELQRTAPGEVDGLHLAAADWFGGHGYPVEAAWHAQAACGAALLRPNRRSGRRPAGQASPWRCA